MEKQCECGGTNVEYCDERGERICEDCGRVLGTYDQQEALEFHEAENGRVHLVGNLVVDKESARSQVTILRNKREIHNICQSLMLTNDVADFAEGVFRTALIKGMTRGRRREITLGACIYMAARLKQKSIMMLDVSDIINASVFTLAHVYNELKKNTGTQVNDVVDPCLFIERFGAGFELGDQTRKVCALALRILHRMKKDWICTGRRPSAVTASALLIAARIYRFNRDCKDAARIAKVSSQTIEHRIQEWANTSTSNLTLSDFLMIDFPDECDPPAFQQSNEQLQPFPAQSVSQEDFLRICKEMKYSSNSSQDDDLVSTNGASKKRKLKTEDNMVVQVEELESYSALVDSIERDIVDMEELIRAASDHVENDDENGIAEEITGRRQLLHEMLIGGPTAFTKNERVHLPLEIDEGEMKTITACGRCWPDEMAGAPSASDIDDDELERMYVLSREDSLNRARWFLRQPANKDFFRRKKRSEDKKRQRDAQQRQDAPSSKNRRNRLNPQQVVEDAKALLEPLKASLAVVDDVNSPAAKVARMEEEEDDEDEELEKEEENLSDADSYAGAVATWEDD